MIRTLLLLPLLALSSAACDAQAPAANAQVPPPIVRLSSDDRLPALTGRVVDRADVLTGESEAKLARCLEALERATTDQLVVVTVDGLQGESIDALGLRLGKGWGIGRKGVDNGVLLIVAPNERQARIEVGFGLEGLLTDERAARILKEEIFPDFKQGQYDRGIADGVAAIAATLQSDPIRPRRRAGAAA